MTDRARGIDVNHWHPVKDFDAVTGAGISFFGAKATEGNTVVDKTFRAHRDGARRQPFDLVIYYHFARSGEPKRQAQRLMDTVGSLRSNERLCLDLEVMPRTEDTIGWVDTFFCELMHETCSDRRPILYTSARIWRMIGNPMWDLASEIDLWAPRYNNQGLEPVPPPPWEKTGWKFWQFSDGETPPFTCPGVGLCDGNYFRDDKAALIEYAKTSAIS